MVEHSGAVEILEGRGSVPIGISVRGEVVFVPRISPACECESMA